MGQTSERQYRRYIGFSSSTRVNRELSHRYNDLKCADCFSGAIHAWQFIKLANIPTQEFGTAFQKLANGLRKLYGSRDLLHALASFQVPRLVIATVICGTVFAATVIFLTFFLLCIVAIGSHVVNCCKKGGLLVDFLGVPSALGVLGASDAQGA